MANSYNGWFASESAAALGGLNNEVVPGTNVKLAPGVRNGDVATVLRYVAQRFNETVEPLVSPGCWGYAYRKNRNANNLSCHASATAIDCNAPRHPNGKRGTFTAKQVAAIRAILAFCEGTVRWGGDFTGTPDEMHFEIVANASRVAAIARKIQAAGGQVAPPAVVTSPASGNKFRAIGLGQSTELWTSGEQVKRDQRQLIDSGFPVGSSGADGFAGPDTVAAIKRAQTAIGGIAVDGFHGEVTRRKLLSVPSFPGVTEQNTRKVASPVTRLYQRKLIARGYGVGKAGADGFHGPATTAALRRFQSRPGLAVDGVGGAGTWTALYTR